MRHRLRHIDHGKGQRSNQVGREKSSLRLQSLSLGQPPRAHQAPQQNDGGSVGVSESDRNLTVLGSDPPEMRPQSMSVAEMFYCKYKNGEIEHKTDLGEVSQDQLIEEIISEALDQLAYALEIKRRREVLREKATYLATHVM